jgi:septal ring factor EnvC (AmiA/AmiB activator)
MSELYELKAKQDSLAEDMSEVKQSLRGISKVLNKLAALEEKHTSTQQTLSRMHSRIDDHDTRIRANEVKMASTMWVERIVWVAVAGIISAVIVAMRG